MNVFPNWAAWLIIWYAAGVRWTLVLILASVAINFVAGLWELTDELTSDRQEP